jgi:hypothetical protein
MDPDPALFVSVSQDTDKKLSFFAYYFLPVHLHLSSKKKKRHRDVTKLLFLNFLLVEGRIRIQRTQNIRIWIRNMHCNLTLLPLCLQVVQTMMTHR